MLRRMASLPSRSQSPGGGAVSPSRVSLRTSVGSTYDSPVLSEPRPLAAVFPGTSMPPSCPSPTSPPSDALAGGGVAGGGGAAGRLGSTLSLVEGRGLAGSPLRPGMTAVPQHLGATLPRQPLAYGVDPYGLYQRSALPRPDSLIGQCSGTSLTHTHTHKNIKGHSFVLFLFLLPLGTTSEQNVYQNVLGTIKQGQ